MNDTEIKLSDLCKAVSIHVDGKMLTEKNEWDDKSWPCTQYRLTLSYQGRKYSLDFWQGLGTKRAPSAADVMSCLLLNASACDMSFDDWCMEYGYDIDSRKAEKTYFECCESGAKLKKLLGKDYRKFQEAENDI